MNAIPARGEQKLQSESIWTRAFNKIFARQGMVLKCTFIDAIVIKACKPKALCDKKRYDLSCSGRVLRW